MQVSLTRPESIALTVAHYGHIAARRAPGVVGCTAATAVGAIATFGPGICIRAIALVIDARKAYDAHLSERVETAFYALAFVALVAFACIASTAISLYRVAAPIVREQIAIQVEDFRNFHAAVSTDPDSVEAMIRRQDALISEVLSILIL